MTVTLLCKENGEYAEEKHVSEFFNGAKWYWIEYENGETKKIRTSEYQLMSIEA